MAIVLRPSAYQVTEILPYTTNQGIDITAWVDKYAHHYSKILPSCFIYIVPQSEHKLIEVHSARLLDPFGREAIPNFIIQNNNVTVESNINLQGYKLIIS